MSTTKCTTADCVGCRNDFYNGKNDIGVTTCGSLAKAKLKTRFELGTNVPMNIREAYRKVSKPDCYHRSGSVFLDAIPSYAETSEQRKQRAEREKKFADVSSQTPGPRRIEDAATNGPGELLF